MQIKRPITIAMALLGALSLATLAYADRGDRGPGDGNGGPGQGPDQRQAPDRRDGGDNGRPAPSRPARSAPVQRQSHPQGGQRQGGFDPGAQRQANQQGWQRQGSGPAKRRQSYEAGAARRSYGQGWQSPNAGRVAAQPYGSANRRQSYEAGAARQSYGQGWRNQASRSGWQNQNAGRVAAQPYGSAGRRESYKAGAVRQAYGRGWQSPNAGRVVSRPYNQALAHRQLAKLGVHSAPAYIAKPADILRADPAHSNIRFPSHGPGGRVVRATLISPQGAGHAQVVAQMNLVNAPIWRDRVQGYDRDEDERGRYYWHHDGGFDFCHYRDDDGFHWYGWYMGDRFFWTRNYHDRWWWYDNDQDRWDYYDDGHWWWQDPYHVGLVYCYNDGDYIPDYTAAPQPVPQPQYQGDRVRAVTSPDGSRTVKVMGGTDDAFLYDASGDPAFTPRYLASGVKSVEYSDPSNGRPLEIILKLEDGSFDLFDAQGQPYAPQSTDDPNSDR